MRRLCIVMAAAVALITGCDADSERAAPSRVTLTRAGDQGDPQPARGRTEIATDETSSDLFFAEEQRLLPPPRAATPRSDVARSAPSNAARLERLARSTEIVALVESIGEAPVDDSAPRHLRVLEVIAAAQGERLNTGEVIQIALSRQSPFHGTRGMAASHGFLRPTSAGLQFVVFLREGPDGLEFVEAAGVEPWMMESDGLFFFTSDHIQLPIESIRHAVVQVFSSSTEAP